MTYNNELRQDANAETSSELKSCMNKWEDWKIHAEDALMSE
jgi:hypothetical protein